MRLGRRAFLQVVGMGAVMVGGAACTPRPASQQPTSVPPTVPPTTAPPAGPPDWAALRAKLPGGLVLPGEPGYDTARRAYNLLYDGHRPAAVANCTRPEDVQACVEVARGSRIPIAARSGGHSYAGYSTPDGGLVVDLGKLADVRVLPDGSAEVGAGARLIDVYAGLAAAGRCLPAGSCPTVGVAGLTLGGGIGVLGRKFGLTCDKLRSARVVTADGQLRTASAESEPDLFWALRGGGGGNLGIVTSFTFDTEQAPAVTVFSLRFPAGSAANVLGAWQQWLGTIPDELWSNCVISAGSPSACRVGGCFVGTSATLNPLLDNLLAKTSARPTARFVQGKGFLDAMRYFAGCSERTVPQCHPQTQGGQLGREGSVATGVMLPAAVDPARFVSTVDGRAGVDILIDSWGGAISRPAPADTAFPHRTALASAQIYASATPATQPRTAQTVAEIRDALTQLTGPRGYVNYIDPTFPNWATTYYGDNLPRLKQTTTHYDPDALFTFPQSLAKA